MSTALAAAEPGSMTAEEFLALPENDEVERWLIRGRLVENNRPLPGYSFPHCRVEAKIVYLLQHWLNQQPAPRGMIVSGEAGFRLSRVPASTVGVDVAYISAEQIAATPKNAFLIEGAPVLAVEILSPSNRSDDVADKIYEFLETGVKMVWRVEPILGLITVCRPDAEPEAFNVHGHLNGESHLPGSRVAVAEIFG